MSNTIKVRGIICVLLGALALSACGSSSSSKSSSKPTNTTAAQAPATTPTTVAVKGKAFNLGAICSCSGVQAAAFGDVKATSQVWAESVNASGGINGSPVKLTVLDDAGDPATALQDAKQLVQGDHVQAIVGDDSVVDSDWASYVTSAGVPVVGGMNTEATFISNPDFFATGPTIPVQLFGMAALAKQAGKKKLGVMYCSETPICAQLVPIAKGAATLSGLGFSSTAISSTAPSYAAQCLEMKSDHVDALFAADNGNTDERVVSGCAQQGFTPAIVTEIGAVLPSWLHDPSFQGALLSASNPGYTDSANPGVAAFLAAIKRFDPGIATSPSFDFQTLYPWVAGVLFQTAAKLGHLSPSSTPAEVKQALYKANGSTLGGLAPPLSIVPGHPVFTPCYYGLVIKGDALAPLNGGKPSCLTTSQTAALIAALKKG